LSNEQIVRVQWLCAQFDGLRTFDDVEKWDAAALDTALNLQKAS
jgi:hypothetical protein